MGAGRKALHFTCSNFPALVALPLGAWTYVSPCALSQCKNVSADHLPPVGLEVGSCTVA